MRKLIFTAFIAITLLAQSACASNTAKKAFEEGKLSMASADYTAAMNYFKLAKDEGYENDEIDNIISILTSYTKAKGKFEKGDFDSAKEELGFIPETYKDYSIASDIEDLQSDIEKEKAALDNIDEKIGKVKKYIANGEYEDAASLIKELYSVNLTDEQKQQTDELNSTLATAQSKIDAASNKKPEVVYVPQTPPKSNNNVVATYYVVNCKKSITLRSAPSTSASEITQIPLGQAVGYIENAGNGFYKINYDGAVGYGLASYLSTSKPGSSSSIGLNTTAKVVNAKEYITLRSAPSTSASEITKIPAGAYVLYLGDGTNGFYYIQYNGMTGYALASYLRIQ